MPQDLVWIFYGMADANDAPSIAEHMHVKAKIASTTTDYSLMNIGLFDY